jgi:hypothetical protein
MNKNLGSSGLISTGGKVGEIIGSCGLRDEGIETGAADEGIDTGAAILSSFTGAKVHILGPLSSTNSFPAQSSTGIHWKFFSQHCSLVGKISMTHSGLSF